MSETPTSEEADQPQATDDVASDGDVAEFLRKLEELGGTSGNGALRVALGWEPDRYWEILNKLAEAGDIRRGRGRGGSVALAESGVVDEQATEASQSAERTQVEPNRIAELELYEPLAKVIGDSWAKSQGFDRYITKITALKGRQASGGKWTRPDICLVSSKSYVFFPEIVFDVITFEVKPSYQISVTGVFEALSHREAGTQAYVIYHCEPDAFDESAEASRIIEMAKRYGVGVIVSDDPADFDSWEEKLSAERVISDPGKIDVFVRRNFEEEQRNEIIKWQK